MTNDERSVATDVQPLLYLESMKRRQLLKRGTENGKPYVTLYTLYMCLSCLKQ